MRGLFLLIVSALITINLFAQKEKVTSLKAVRGEYSVVLEYSDVTGREAVILAREDAKRKALEEVCGSRINIWDQMETSSAGDVYNSLSINQVDGEILEFEIINEGWNQSSVRTGETVFYCVADIKVKRGVAPDPNFGATVSGVKSVYYVDELLQFKIVTYQDCYLKIFLMEDEKIGYMLYPNELDCDRMLEKGVEFSLKNTELAIGKSTDNPIEINRLVFVFTKVEMAFAQMVTSRAEIEKWIAKIPNDQKYLQFAVMEIREK